MTKTNASAASGPRGMTRVLKLFELLSAYPDGLSLTDLAIELGEPKSTLLNSLRALENDNYLITFGTIYRLGPRTYRLAAEITSSWSLPRLMGGFLRDLAEKAQETALLSVIDLQQGRFVYIDAIESRHNVRYVIKLGSSGPLYATATGRVLLAYQPVAYQEQYIANCEFKSLTSHTIANAQILRDRLAEIRQNKVEVSAREVIEDGAAIASPIFGPAGDCIAALSIAMPVARLDDRDVRLKEIVTEISARASGEVQKLS